MILLDTNVVSEVMRPEPEPAVIDWLNRADAGELYLSAVSVGEIEFGLDVLPEGRHKDDLCARFKQFVARAFAYRTLPFDDQAAQRYGPIMGARRRAGRPMSAPDGQIAAIAVARGMAVATRNVADFSDCGIEVVNPWTDRGTDREM
ncbi:MAG: type II toxin-antitoxin system VapC family toxin [Phycisphaerae bacterium]